MREAANGMTNGFKHSWSSQVISAFGKSFNAKFAREFLKARVVKGVGINALELENLHGRHLGAYQAKDIRVYTGRRHKVNKEKLHKCGHTSQQASAPR